MTEHASRPLHVGLNLLYLVRDSGGSGTYARELIGALCAVEPEIRITAWVGRGAPDDLPAGAEWVRVPVASTGSPFRVPVELLALGLDARRRGIDVVHGLAYATPIVAPGVATVVTILDVTWRRQPEAVTWRVRTMFGGLSAVCARSADRVIAISHAARDELVCVLGIDPAKVDVTPLGAAAASRAVPVPETELRARLGVGDARVVLCVGQVSRHKNLVTLVEALPRLRDKDAVLVVAGRHTDHTREVQARAHELGVAARLVMPGFVDDTTLEGLYALADVFVFPTRHEGFGLPLLEAMSRGVPAACADLPVLREVGGDAPRYFDPTDAGAIAASIDEPGDPRRGLSRAAEFTSTRTALATLASYRRALEA